MSHKRIERLLKRLIDVKSNRVLIPASCAAPGYWFGGGNMVLHEGAVYLCGRYRDQGDSRTGTKAGVRGRECAVFKSEDGGMTFHKTLSLTKQDLSTPEAEVLSIEGTALHQLPCGSWELFVATEKKLSYPRPYEQFQKTGTGIWSIDRLTGEVPDKMSGDSLVPVLRNYELPEYLHIKDPTVWDLSDGSTAMVFCTHPFTWASGGSGLAVRSAGEDYFQVEKWELTQRGPAWDVAVCRITGTFPLPCGEDEKGGELWKSRIFFYDGAECMRPHNGDTDKSQRPRGFCCEELGGAFVAEDIISPVLSRIDSREPLFISPHATGCCRYIDALVLPDGVVATWQQAQPDGSQPLVGNKLNNAEIEEILKETVLEKVLSSTE